MIGEPDAGKLHVRFDEGIQETCDIATRLCSTLRRPERLSKKSMAISTEKGRPETLGLDAGFQGCNGIWVGVNGRPIGEKDYGTTPEKQ